MKQRIAIVGMGGIFPGAGDLDQFWEHIVAARDCTREPPAGRWLLPLADAYDPAGPKPDKVYSKRACFVEGFTLGHTGLALDSAFIDSLDPMVHLLLHAGRQAWQDGRTERIDKHRTGIIIGNIVLPTDAASRLADEHVLPQFEQQLFGTAARPAATHPYNAYVAGLPAGLLAQALGLTGGSYTLDAACASSLYALKYAVDELQAGRADAMLCGGLSRPDSLYTQMGFSALHAISASGRCAPFDRRADGLVVGEGCGMLLLKRLPDALAQGDRIYATIAGMGLSNDIGGNLMAPDSEGQLRAMYAAYQQADWHPGDVDLIECHGTGTPIGDAVEFDSLRRLHGEGGGQRACVIGSVKSNIGHLLTAAGAAGVIKVLLAMQHRVLPPTANFESAAVALDASPFRVLQLAADWPRRTAASPRRAAVSAFGFGGINAHVLLEEWCGEPPPDHAIAVAWSPRMTEQATEDIAIIGMATWHGECERLAAFAEQLFGRQSQPQRTIAAIGIPAGRFRIPPTELKAMLPQQVLMLQVAADALADAGMEQDEAEALREAGAYIGIALDLNTTNYHLRWGLLECARRWAVRLGLRRDDDALAAWTGEIRQAISPPLTANRTMGALGGIIASRIARAYRLGGPSFTVSNEQASGLRALMLGTRALQRQEINTAIVGAVDFASDVRLAAARDHTINHAGDAAVSLILKRHKDALKAGDRIYALVSGLGNAMQAGAAIGQGLREAGLDADEREGGQGAAMDYAEYGAAAGLLNVVRDSLSLHHRLLPGRDGGQPQPWLRDRKSGPRHRLVQAGSVDGNHIAVVLQQAESSQPLALPLPLTLLSLTAVDPGALAARLQQLTAQATDQQLSVQHLARRCLQENDQQHPLALSLLAGNPQHLRQLIERALPAVQNNTAIADGEVFFSPQPLAGPQAATGRLAFVFPGAGNHFHGMGREAACAWPDVLERLDQENDYLASQFAGGRFWSASDGSAPSCEEVIFGQVWLGTLISDILARHAVRPDAIIGYSLGETTGLFASRTWVGRDQMLRRMQRSSLFVRDLAGPFEAARRAWGITDEAVTIDWQAGVVNRSARQIKASLHIDPGGRQRVYLLIVNTPNECVIGGERTAVEALVANLACQFHPLHGVTTVHCEVALPVAEEYRQLHLLKTTPPAGVQFYSTAWGRPYEVTSEAAADSLIGQAVQPFDYPRLIERAYQDGVRLFIEPGPGSSCSRMIGDILKGRPHLALAACIKGQHGAESVLRVLAQLNTERVAMDLHDLYREPLSPDCQPSPAMIDIPVVRPAIRISRPAPSPVVARGELPAAGGDVVVHPAMQVVAQLQQVETAHAAAQAAFLQVAQGISKTMHQAVTMQLALLHAVPSASGQPPVAVATLPAAPPAKPVALPPRADVVFDRAMCMEFATGAIARVLGPAFAEVDSHPTRVRLPAPPLMLVDRILTLEGAPASMAPGRVVTEHDVKPGAWYLDGGRIPTCIAVEAGQADLFLSAYLGIDLQTRGRACYRLLDAEVTFHAPLPQAGQVIRYDIRIERFFRQGDTWLFHFRFDGEVDGRLLITMRHGCAGFFTEAQLAAGKGIVLSALDGQVQTGSCATGWQALVPMQAAAYSDAQLDALRAGDLAACFGSAFAGLDLQQPAGLPGGRMTLVHRILELNPAGGRFGMGHIIGEADIRPDDWFITCHFIDDQVMPGTLMYECCLHTLRVYLLRLGWVGEAERMVYEPVPGVAGKLKCRGQVLASTNKVQYAISIKTLGYTEAGIPYVIADALMSADGQAIVQMTDLSLQLSNLRKQQLHTLWRTQKAATPGPVLFDYASIHAFAVGKPSEAFGERYRVFDDERVIARLPGPPFQFLDRIVSIDQCQPWQLAAGGVIRAAYDVPADAWYFIENRQPEMPFAVLLEVALQPCGWLAAYLGSALTSQTDLSFRNLGGTARQCLPVRADVGTLTTEIRITRVSQSGGMIIQHYDFAVSSAAGLVYQGDTYFGFFSRAALARQVGLRECTPYQPAASELAGHTICDYPSAPPFPARMMRMVDRIDGYSPDGGPQALGFICGQADVDPAAWFFQAHFYQDPVWPGSLGLESFIQLLKYVAYDRWGGQAGSVRFAAPGRDAAHSWVYRGQILPTDSQVSIEAVITARDEAQKRLTADGLLSVDGRIIYQMRDFTLTMSSS